MLNTMDPQWDAANNRLVFNVPADFGASITSLFTGRESLRISLIDNDTVAQHAWWRSCQGQPAGELPDGVAFVIAPDSNSDRKFAIEAYHSNGDDCGTAKIDASLPFDTAPDESHSEEQALPIVMESTVRTFPRPDSTSQVVVVLRYEGGGGTGTETSADRIDRLVKTLRTEARRSHGRAPVTEP
jgi:hypothetical protein